MSTFDGFIREFKGIIRVDNFQQSDWVPEGCRSSMVYLLSHAHSDHMVGLEKFTGSRIYCSQVTKDIVLKIRPARARINEANGFGNGKIDRTYKNLLPSGPREESLLKALQPFDPQQIVLNISDKNNKCRLTLIPANHCPGSVMFLIQMWHLNVLYTGDIRAEPWWVESLTKEPQLAPFVASPQGTNHRINTIPRRANHQKESKEQTHSGPFTPFDNIYLDTSSLLTKMDVLTKEDAIQITIQMMSAYPDNTNFFINSWTWGYEELLQQIAVHFRSMIHVDEYKHEIFKQPRFRAHFPLLSACITLDSTTTRFHACERNLKCPEVREGGGRFRQSQSLDSRTTGTSASCRKARVVCVNPWEITSQNWKPYKANLDVQLADAARHSSENPESKHDLWPPYLICPLTRHSSFNEILNFVSAFRPKCIFPNTTHEFTGFVEFDAIPKLFGSVLDSNANRTIARQASQFKKDYEIRHHTRLVTKSMSVDLLDWKGIHLHNLEKAFRIFEQREFDSEKYRSMWKEFFQTINQADKHEAASFIEGRPAENCAESREITIISSSDEQSHSPSQTAAGTSDTESVAPSETSEFNEDDTYEGGTILQSSRRITPSATTPVSRILIPSPSTTKGESSPITYPCQESLFPKRSSEFKVTSASSDHSLEGRSLSNLAACLQRLEYDFFMTASAVARQLCRYHEVLNQLDKDCNHGGRKPKKRKKSIVPGNSEDALVIWAEARDSIVGLVQLRSKITHYRQKGVELIMLST